MKIAASLLAEYTALPETGLRELLDDTGLEVKRVEETGLGPVYTLELLANRGDHHCYLGVARELSGRTGAGLCAPPVAALALGASPVPLQLQTQKVLVYSATLLVRTEAPAAELADLRILDAAGMAPVSAPVDATNVVNLELGQPTHAFDADTIRGAIVLRESRAGERAWPLFRPEPIALPEGTVVIADEEKILAIAGVIGCEESKTTAATTRLLLESATFDPVSVRKASRALDIATDSSARFERGADPSAPLQGAGRVVALLEATGAWRRVGSTGLVGDWADPARTIALDLAATARFLDVPISAGEASDRLTRYGFTVTATAPGALAVRVPPHRLWDVEHDADLYEELAKSIGYNHTPETLPPVGQGAVPTPEERVRDLTSEVLVGNGLYEVIVDGFYGRPLVERLDLPEGHPLLRHVTVQNALDRGYSLLKNTALHQALEVVGSNLRRRPTDIAAFEWTRTFHPDPTAANRVCTERPLLWVVCCGSDRRPAWERHSRPADVYFLKGLVEEIGLALGLPLTVRVGGRAPILDLLHPGRRAEIWVQDTCVGALGEIHPSVVRAAGIKRQRPCYLELSLEGLMRPGQAPAFVEPTSLQPIERALAFTLPHGVEAGDVLGALQQDSPDWLDQVAITDLYRHEEQGAPLRTVTFSLRFLQSTAGRTSDEINAELMRRIAVVQAALGDRGVRLRS